MEFDELKFFTGFTEFDYPSRFAECKNLVSINLSNIVKVSGYNGYQRYGFENCTSLKNVVINPAMTEIGYQAFLNCTSLEEIDLSHIKTIYDGAFQESGIKDANISNLETIGPCAFLRCSNITGDMAELRLPRLKGTLGQNAFVKSSITRILDLGQVEVVGEDNDPYKWGPFTECKKLIEATLPTTVTSIGFATFRSCSSLQYVKILASVPPALGDDAFSYTNNCPLYVPDSSVNAYKAATNWSNYASRIKPLSQFTE